MKISQHNQVLFGMFGACLLVTALAAILGWLCDSAVIGAVVSIAWNTQIAVPGFGLYFHLKRSSCKSL